MHQQYYLFMREPTGSAVANPLEYLNSKLVNLGLRANLWRPQGLNFIPLGVSGVGRMLALYYHLVNFYGGTYMAITVTDETGELVHRSVVIRSDYRRSWLKGNSFEFTQIYSAPRWRSRGIATQVCIAILSMFPEAIFFWMCREENIASQKIANKLGFKLSGHCKAISINNIIIGFNINNIGHVIDKKIDQISYNQRAAAMLVSGITTSGKGAQIYGAASLPPTLRAPYLEYEAWISTYLDRSKTALELCAGTGLHTGILLSTGAYVVATDISQFSLEVLRKNLSEVGGNFGICVSDMEAIPFKEGSFDLITSAGSLSYGDPVLVLKEIKRLLKPNGRFICVDSFNENPIYRYHRIFSYLRGVRSKSTLDRMPTFKTIKLFGEEFSEVKVSFFGGFTWLASALSRIVGEERAAQLLDYLDKFFRVNAAAYKIVLTAIK